MNIYSYFRKYAVPVAGTLLILATTAGCKDELGLQFLQSTEYVSFHADMRQTGIKGETRGSVGNATFVEEEWGLTPYKAEQGESTRATLTDNLSGEARVFAYNFDTGEESPYTAANKVINGIDYTFVDNIMTSQTPQKWSSISKKELEVYSYTPVLDTEIFNINSNGEPTIEYTINNDVSKQIDLILADAAVRDVSVHNRKPLNLTFKHALAAVRFKSGFTDAITVKSIEIKDVYNQGTYALWDKSGHGNWKRLNTTNPSKDSYKISFGDAGKNVNTGEYIATGEDTFILMPQTLPSTAKVILTLSDRSIEIPLEHFVWESGVMVTYTIYESEAPSYIYFDLAAANVLINGNEYNGARFSPDDNSLVEVKGTIQPGEEYYVYQSTPANRAKIWTKDETGKLLTFTRPEYEDVVVESSGKSWKEFITNNSSVEDVIDNWKTAAEAAGMQPADHYIDVKGGIGSCTINLDNIYSKYEQTHGGNQGRTFAGIGYKPTGGNSKLTLDLLGDNRLGAIHYDNRSNSGNKLIIRGNGSLTVADPQGNNSNWWNSVIGNNDNNNGCYGIQIDGGVIFAGSTAEEDCTAIGGGGNGVGEVTINGGVVTAVSSTTGTAIGGGIGHNEPGGAGLITITGGTVYAYNFKQKEKNIPVAAIGGAGSMTQRANDGTTIRISGGTIYAESFHGPALGGGGSSERLGGNAKITITGGNITATTKNLNSCAIGGGTSCNKGGSSSGSEPFNGGDATITISGNPVIRTGSIGGGITGDAKGKIGSAKINISGGTIQGQFLLAKGSSSSPSFIMTGGAINGKLSDGNFTRKREDGGAVHMEEGKFEFKNGVIENCTGVRGGAVYLAGGEFIMSGGTIRDCASTSHGGAIFMDNSSVNISGGEIINNLAYGGNGGGVYIIGNDFHMSGGTRIEGNSSINKGDKGGYGGGVYVFSDDKDVTVDLHSGNIIGNTSERKGGGVCVVINSDYRAIVTVGKQNGGNENPLITGNHTLLQGAGLHVQGTRADITVESGKIKGNKVGAYVPNNDVSNEGGLVSLNGGDVTHNVITFHANYAGADPESERQDVVTATRSQLIPPAFRRQGYNLEGWSTKKDGTGVLYQGNDIVAIDSDLDLYAKWLPK